MKRLGLLHFHIDAKPVSGFCADVQPESLYLWKNDVDFGILDRNGLDFVIALQVEYTIQETDKRLLVA